MQLPQFEWLAKVPYQLFPGFLLVLSGILLMWQQYRADWWLIRTLVRIICSPFLKVVFRDFYLADQLTSISIVLYDLEFTLCFFFSDAWTGGSK
jgi:hypothetical protein